MGLLCRSLKPDLTWEELEEVMKKLSNQELAGSILTPESVADAALFLASSESAFMSGHNLVLDGGFSTRRGPAQYNF